MNEEVTPETEADAFPAVGDDTEGHRKSSRIGEAGDDDDTEGHRKSSRIGEAGDDDDTEGHIGKRNH